MFNWIMYELSSRCLMLILLAQLVSTRTMYDVGDVLVALAMYNTMRWTVLQMLPEGLIELGDILVATRRIQVKENARVN